jgi:predicted O-methyltransferase YrrM
LRSDHRYINVTDLGSGSGKHKKIRKKVSDISKYSAVPKKYGALLSSLAAEFGNQLIVEFGTSFGISTMYMASSCKNTRILTMEGCPETAKIAYHNFKELALENISILTGPFDENLQHISDTGLRPGLVFIDGNHRKIPLIRYFNFIAEISDYNTVVVIDDINNSKEMEKAWIEIKESEKVSLTIDIFRFGIVFFRSGVSHYDYVIRY